MSYTAGTNPRRKTEAGDGTLAYINILLSQTYTYAILVVEERLNNDPRFKN